MLRMKNMRSNQMRLMTLLLLIFLGSSSWVIKGDLPAQQIVRQTSHIQLSTGACSQLQGCAACDAGGNCYKCIDSEQAKIQSNKCECLSPAATFDQSGFCVFCSVVGCKVCAKGKSSVCEKCTDKEDILRDGKCFCKDGFKRNEKGECERETCPYGYYEQEGVCGTCNLNNCLDCSSQRTCTICDSQTMLFASICMACLDGCKVCSQDNPNICLNCQKGHFLDRHFCYQCPKNCSSCSSFTECSSCMAPYQLVENKCLLPCKFPCQTCATDDKTSCSSCFPGYQLSGSACIESIDCNQTSTCSECPLGYSQSQGKCLPCLQNCQLCPNRSCIQCKEGFDLFGVKCVKEGQFQFPGNPQLSKHIRKNQRLKKKLQKIVKRMN